MENRAVLFADAYKKLLRASETLIEMSLASGAAGDGVVARTSDGRELLVSKQKFAEYRLAWKKRFKSEIRGLKNAKADTVRRTTNVAIAPAALVALLENSPARVLFDLEELVPPAIAASSVTQHPYPIGGVQEITTLPLVLASLEKAGHVTYESQGAFKLSPQLLQALSGAGAPLGRSGGKVPWSDVRLRVGNALSYPSELAIEKKLAARYQRLLESESPLKAACTTLLLPHNRELLWEKNPGLYFSAMATEKASI